MKSNAMALANHFVNLSREQNIELKLLGLVKRVYIAHGFSLAIFDTPAIDHRFDIVEAWRLGPVIPSVYHSFKHLRDRPITEEAVITDYKGGKISFNTPQLVDKNTKDIANAVWKRYLNHTDAQLIEILHRDGTPWKLCYVDGENREIPDLYTKVYYKKWLELIE